MRKSAFVLMGLVVLVCAAWWTAAAQSAALPAAAVAAWSSVPNLVSYSGVLKDSSGRVLTGVTGVTFLLYENEQGGAPLWMETQNVAPDRIGHYTVQLGATTASGMPSGLFVNGQARWLAVQVGSESEQSRAMLVAVPYAMKAGDAATIGGLPPSAFVLAAPRVSGDHPASEATSVNPAAVSNVTTSGGVVGKLALWDTTTDIKGSTVTQTGSGATAKIGINTATPATALDVNGGATVRGALNLTATGTATASGGKNSQPEAFVASSFNSSTLTAVSQKFQWQAEPVGNNTATASGTFNLLFAQGTGAPAETGLKIASNGRITFASGQVFPGTGSGTITGVTAGTDLTGGGLSGTVTLKLDRTKVPELAANNTFSGTQTINNAVSINSGVTTNPGLNINTSMSGGDGIDVFSYNGYGVNATSHSSDAVYGSAYGSSGVHGVSSLGTGVYGSGGGGYGVYGISGGTYSVYADGTTSGYGLYSTGSTSAAYFSGNVSVSGTLSKGGGSFKIDHPLDPANKYLYHSFVESPDMMNIYNGNVILGSDGAAWITLPDYFEALNQDFRYQLTAVGKPSPNLYVAQEIAGNRFQIAGGTPGGKVSWQVTGIRHDAFARAHPIIPEVEKTGDEKGKYLHPVENGQPKSMGIDQSRRNSRARAELQHPQ